MPLYACAYPLLLMQKLHNKGRRGRTRRPSLLRFHWRPRASTLGQQNRHRACNFRGEALPSRGHRQPLTALSLLLLRHSCCCVLHRSHSSGVLRPLQRIPDLPRNPVYRYGFMWSETESDRQGMKVGSRHASALWLMHLTHIDNHKSTRF